MAEFSLGLTKTAVEGTLSLVKSAVEEEKRLRDTVQNDLVFITDEFDVMRSFLHVANREHAANDEVALALVRQLRTLAFDVEDCVENVVHLDKPSRWGWLRRAWHTAVYWHAPPLPLDDAVDEMKQLKARVQDLRQRNQHYSNLIRNSNNIQQGPPADQEIDSTCPSSALFSILRDAWKDSDKWCHNICNLQELISGEGDDDLHVISVISVGGGGDLGTASIIRKAYCDKDICDIFKCRAWVKLTHPFNHDEFIKSVFTQLCVTSPQENTTVDFWTRMDLIKAELIKQRYLVVLEDVLTLEEWDVVRRCLPESKDSRIVVSTPQLGIALLCTREPYQVSELQHFSDGRFICAFYRQKMQSTIMDDFKRQLQSGGGVISVLRAGNDVQMPMLPMPPMSMPMPMPMMPMPDLHPRDICGERLVDIMYKGIINRLKEFDGIQFERHSWVDVPATKPFDLKVFAQRLFLNFYSDEIQSGEIMEVGKKGVEGLIERCREFLFRKKCLVVINGVRSRDDWDQIKSYFLGVPSSSEPSTRTSTSTRTPNSCILVVTDDDAVARHCVVDDAAAVFRVEDLKADKAIRNLIKKGTWYCQLGEGKKQGRLFYHRKADADDWARFMKGRDNYTRDLLQGKSGLVMVSGRNVTAVRLKAFLRSAYHQHGSLSETKKKKLRPRSWVDVPKWRNLFNLMDISWRLLLDLHSDDPGAKENIAVGLMDGTITEPMEECRKLLLREEGKGYLVVIHGQGFSKQHWDFISDELLSSGNIQGTIIIAASDSDYLSSSHYDWLAAQYSNPTNRIEAKDVGYVDDITKEYYRLFYNNNKSKRMQKATEEGRAEFQLVGREMECFHHLPRLLNNKNVSVVSVWGIAGVGKSSLVTKVYYKMIQQKKKFKSFGWVDVPDPFNLTQLCCRLLVDFYYDDPQDKETAAVGLMEGSLDPIQECFKIIHKGKCLVVIDGLHSKEDWDKIRGALLSEPTNTGSTIVVITSAKDVAKHCVQNVQDEVLNIRRLEADAAHDLLARKIASDYQPLTSEEMEITKSIVTKCGGLPKVMTTVGEACNLHLRRRSRTGFSYKYCMWPPGGTFISDLETKSEFHGLRPLFSWMQSYFDACSDSIKPCIFYLSIFPPAEKKSIRRQRLLWRWIAEGYCRGTSDGRTEENGLEYISELMDLSIIMQQSPRSKVFCEINGFFHEYIISRPMEDNLVFALEKGCSVNPTHAWQHLTIRSGWDRKDKIVFESIDFSRLRSLTVFGKWEPFFISSKNIDMRLLRVLDLEDAKDVTNEDLEQIAKLLCRLKFLSVRGHTKITCLPSSIGGVRQLQTLDIRYTSIVTLPPVITKLEKLRYIRAGRSTAKVWDWNESDILVPADGEKDTASAAAAEGGSNSTATTAECSRPRTLVSKLCRRGDGGLDSNINNNEPVAAGVTVPVEVSCYNRPRTLASSLLCRGSGVDNGGVMVVPTAGVTVPAGIGNLTIMHTLGVVKVSGQCSKDMAIFEELTQLHKLGVSGINRGNIVQFCSAISGLSHLKSLSVEVDKDDDRLDALGEKYIPEPAKSIQSLKLYGRAHKLLLAWLKHLNHLERLKLDLTIGKPEEFRFQDPPKISHPLGLLLPVGHLPTRPIQDGKLRTEFRFQEPPPQLSQRLGPLQVGHLRIRPIQDGKLRIGRRWLSFAPDVVEVQCSSDLRLKFDPDQHIKVLKVHFSSSRGSISGLSNLQVLEEVWLKGYNDAQKHSMQQQINGVLPGPRQKRTELKLF